MTVEELEVRCVKLFGKKHWKSTLAKMTGRDFTTVRRWGRGKNPVPPYVELLLDTVAKQRELERITSKLAKIR